MKKIFAVIRREFVERVRTRAFVISTVLLPVFMVLMVLLPGLMMSGGDRTRNVAVVDASGSGLGQPVGKVLKAATFGDAEGAKPRYRVQVFPADAASLAQVRDGLIAKTGFAKGRQHDGWDGVLVVIEGRS